MSSPSKLYRLLVCPASDALEERVNKLIDEWSQKGYEVEKESETKVFTYNKLVQSSTAATPVPTAQAIATTSQVVPVQYLESRILWHKEIWFIRKK